MTRSIQISALALTAAAITLAPLAVAQTLDFSQLVVVTEDIAPEARFAKKIELTTDALKKADERVEEMRAKLDGMELEEDSIQEELRGELIARTQDYSAFYEEQKGKLSKAQTIEEVDALIDTIIAYRESTYAPGAKEILEFILVYSYTPSVLELANQRMENIRADVKKLEGLDLVEPSTFASGLGEAEKILQEAKDLQTQAASLLIETYTASKLEATASSTAALATSTTPLAAEFQVVVTPKSLAESSLTKIKGLYQLFMETGDRVNQALGIGS